MEIDIILQADAAPIGSPISLSKKAMALDLNARVRKLASRSITLKGVIYRSAAPKYATSADLLSGAGSQRYGARWNPPGLAAVYGAFTPQTALEESFAHAAYYHLPVHSCMPRTFVAIEFDLAVVLDLTDGQVRRVLAVSEKRMLECDWRIEIQQNRIPITQQIGLAASQAGFEAVLVRSAADPSGKNLVIFAANLQTVNSVRIMAADKLDRS